MLRSVAFQTAVIGLLLANAALRAEPPANEVEVLARGPVHEAYAEPIDPNPVPGPVILKEPPAPIDELPPDQKPAGDQVTWLPGYFSYDAEREDFIWISGFWRAPPPNRVWVPGSWRKLDNGWQWVGGFWNIAQQEQADIQYLPEPPASMEAGPATPQPTVTAIYVPGAWMWRGRYVWRPGYWVEQRPNWIWIPAHYRWTPAGYIYIEGYWDYPLATRGMMFAPVYIPRTVYLQPRYYYAPTVVVRDDCMYGALFVRRGYSTYYFGDYFGPTYATEGYTSWVGYSGGRDVVVVRGFYDPMYSYYRVTYRDDPYWRVGITEVYVGRYKGDIPPPPRTLVQQNTIIQNTTIVNNNITVNNKTTNVTNVTMLTTVSNSAKAKNIELQPVSMETRQQHVVASRQVQAFAQQRGQAETKLVAQHTGAKHDAPRAMKLDVPKNYAARSAPAPTTPATGTNSITPKLDPNHAIGIGTPKTDSHITTIPKGTGSTTNPKGTTSGNGVVIPPSIGSATGNPKGAAGTGVAGPGNPLDHHPIGGTGTGTGSTALPKNPPPKTPVTPMHPPTNTHPKPKDKEKDRDR